LNLPVPAVDERTKSGAIRRTEPRFEEFAVASKKQSVLIELLSQHRKTRSTSLTVPTCYRKPGTPPSTGRRGLERPSSAEATPVEDPSDDSATAGALSSDSGVFDARRSSAESGEYASPTATTAIIDVPADEPEPQTRRTREEPAEPAPSRASSKTSSRSAVRPVMRDSESFVEVIGEDPENPKPAEAAPASDWWGALKSRVSGWMPKKAEPVPTPESDEATEPTEPTERPASRSGERAAISRSRVQAAIEAASGGTGDEPKLITLTEGRVVVSLSYPLVAISVMCLVMLCAICYLLGHGASRKAPAPAPAKAEVPAPVPQVPQPAQAVVEPPVVDDIGGGVSAAPQRDPLERPEMTPAREDGLNYFVLATTPAEPGRRDELLKAAIWLRDRHGLETTVECVHKNHWSLVGADGFAHVSQRDAVTYTSRVEAYGKEYVRIGRCDFKNPYPRKFPWGG